MRVVLRLTIIALTLVMSILYGISNYHALAERTVTGITLNPHLPVRINGDAEFTAHNGVSGGDGTLASPYLIENLIIDGYGYGYCIYIGNTTAHFTIRNCTIYNATGNHGMFYWDTGIVIYNATNGTIENCTIYSNGKDSFWQYLGSGVFITESASISVQNCTLSANYKSGIYITASSNCTILTSNISRTYYTESVAGIYIQNATNISIIDSAVSLCNPVGIRCENITQCRIAGNNLTDNYGQSGYSLYLLNTSKCSIASNYISKTEIAIRMVNTAQNDILNNTIEHTPYGVYCTASFAENISENHICTEWVGTSGAAILLDTEETCVARNIIYPELTGILLRSGHNNTLRENYIQGKMTYAGTGIAVNSTQTSILWNIVKSNYLGISVSAPNNTIHHNALIGNQYQAEDTNANRWDDGSEGNYWDNWLLPDADANGIVDVPYIFPQSIDNYPLTKIPHLPVRINSDADFTVLNGIYAGNGSALSPYVLENLRINGTGFGYCIYAGNTTVHFIIQNCSLACANGNSEDYYWNAGICLFNGTQTAIQNSTICMCTYGIYLIQSEHNTITSCILANHTCGIRLYRSSGCTVENISIENASYGIYLWLAQQNTICSAGLHGNGNTGIYLYESNQNEITECRINGWQYGIYCYCAQNNKIERCSIADNRMYGLYLDYGCMDNKIYYCVFQNNTIYEFEHGNEIKNTWEGNIWVMCDVPESALLWVLVLSTGWCVSVWRRSTGR